MGQVGQDPDQEQDKMAGHPHADYAADDAVAAEEVPDIESDWVPYRDEVVVAGTAGDLVGQEEEGQGVADWGAADDAEEDALETEASTG